ncbi:hypothetical protein [Empedobacter tilapiae]|uniref:Lipoprotein n=1 Tax=Empedobacter tilapiae TaxID=2491114 RepID=A0A4Z1BDP6_9FLAO|nr:hypothetical protein [Empedobacter tilapiae]TGN22562.1 hypothetical protein E4J94_16085 [Empedobacter tilapiae]
MKKILYILPLLLFTCNNHQANQDNILINKDWEIEGLKLNQSTIKDFEKFCQTKNITFKKDSIDFFGNLSDTIEYCGNDYNLQTITYKFWNESLGINFYFQKKYFSDSILFKNYDISKFQNIQFQQDFTNIISKKQLGKYFSRDQQTNLYETKVNQNNVLIGAVALDKETYEIKVLKVYQD